MEKSTRPVRVGRLNSQQKLVAEESCKPEKPSKVELATRRSTSRKALSDLTNTGFSYKEKCARDGVNKQLEKPAANLLESFLDSVSKDSRGRISGSGEDIGKKKQTKNGGDNCNLKTTGIKMRRMEMLQRESAEKDSSHNAEKLQSERGCKQSMKETSLPIAMSVEKKPWNASQHDDDRDSVKVFGSNLNLKKEFAKISHQSSRSKRRKDLVQDDQVAVIESLRRLSSSGDVEKGLELTAPNQVSLEAKLNNVEQNSNTESTTVKAPKVSIRRNNSRAARKVINYSEDFDDFINYEKSNVNMTKPDCHNVRNAISEAAADQMGNKRARRSSDLLDTERAKVGQLETTNLGKIEHKAFTETPSGSAGSVDQALRMYCEEKAMRTAPKQVVPSRKSGKLPPKYGQRLNTRCDDSPSLELASKHPKSPVRGGHPLAKENTGTKGSPASCRKRKNLASDTTAFGEVYGATGGSEIMSSMKLDAKGIDRNNQRGPKRGKKSCTIDNLKPFDSAANADVLECFPVILNDLSKILAENPSEHKENLGESQEGIEAATPDGTHVIISSLDDKTVSCKAIVSFEDADLPPKVMDCCKQLGKPTLLQAYALPLLLAGHDMFCNSGPSSGQLYTYGVPAMVHMLTKKKSFSRNKPSPLCLVLTSSSELVVQITQSFEETFSSLRMKIANLIDGDLSQAEKNILKPGKAILITTPESFQKVLESERCSLTNLSFLVLDRADTMLHCGSDSAIREILSQTPSSRQTAIFASMWLPELEQLLKDALHKSNAVKIDAQDIRGATDTVENQIVSQTVEVLEETARDARLTALVQTYQKKQRINSDKNTPL